MKPDPPVTKTVLIAVSSLFSDEVSVQKELSRFYMKRKAGTG